MTDIDIEKKEIRKHIKNLKKEISFEEKKKRSKEIFRKIELLESFKNANTIMLYWSMIDEVSTHDFVIKCSKSKTVILPAVDGDNLILKKFTGIDALVDGDKYSIAEPNGESIADINSIDLIIVPGVAFDVNNNRMGRGKAYYDKILSNIKAPKIGVCFNFQLLDYVPTDKYDIAMNNIISE